MKFRFLICTLACSPLMAMQMDEEKVLAVYVPEKGMTRISVKSDKISHIFATPGGVTANITHHESGHVFVSSEGLPKEMHLTVMTASGLTQDLKVLVKSGTPSGPILLEKESKSDKKEGEISLQKKAGEILSIFSEGGIAPGFKQLPIFEIEERKLLHMSFEVIQSFENESFRVLVYQGTNKSSDRQVVSPKSLTTTKDLALSLMDSEVESGGQATFYVIQQIKENKYDN